MEKRRRVVRIITICRQSRAKEEGMKGGMVNRPMGAN